MAKLLSKDAIKTLKRVQKTLLKEPKKFDMFQWGTMYDKSAPGYTKKNVGAEYYNSCGTVGCIAGWVCVLGDKDFEKKVREAAKEITRYRKREEKEAAEYSNRAPKLNTIVGRVGFEEWDGEWNDIPAEAASLLGVEKGNIQRLFYYDQWPIEFSERFDAAKTPAKKAKIAVEVIQDFIDNDGNWSGRDSMAAKGEREFVEEQYA